MSARKAVYSIVDKGCDGGVSPNAYVPRITAEVRVHFPPYTVTQAEVTDALMDAYSDAMRQIKEHFK